MIICVDVGNTTVALGLSDKDEILQRVFFDHEGLDCKNCFLHELNTFKELSAINVEAIMYSSVVPEIDESLKGALETKFNAKCLNIDKKNSILREYFDVATPEETGDDLVADVVGGSKKYGYPLLIVDVGTASKILYIDERNKFTSANILPGLGLCTRSLFKDTSLLPDIRLSIPNSIFAKDTISAMNTGLVLGHADMIEGLLNRYKKELNKDIKVVLTGGYLDLLGPLFNKEYIVDMNLTMIGLEEIYKIVK